MDTAGDERRQMHRQAAIAGCGVALITFLFYLPTLEFGFLHWDDDVNVFQNPHVQGLGRDNLAWMFTDFGHAIRYKPLSWLGWAIVHAVFGLNPFGFHLANVLLHSLNAGLLFGVLQKLLDDSGRSGPGICAIGALFWALHPLRVEPVTWVTGMPYGLALAFMLGATLCYLRANERGVGFSRGYWAAVGLFALAVLTYPVVLGFPALLMALDHFHLRRFERWDNTCRRTLVAKIPFLAISLCVIGLTVYGRFRFTEYWIKPAGLTEFGILARASQACYVWAYYVWKPLFPIDLAPVYTMLIWNQPWDWEFLLSMLGVVVATMIAFVNWRRWPFVAALWYAHLGLLVPMLGLTERPHYPHDRYGIINGILWSFIVVALMQRVRNRSIIGAAVVVLILCGSASLAQQQHWRSEVAFFEHMAAKLQPNEYRNLALLNLGEALTREGRFEEAIPCFERAGERDLPWAFPFDDIRLAIGHARALLAAERWPAALAKLREADELLARADVAAEDPRRAAIQEAIVAARTGARE
jgi:hypothetical protein